jgi:hypothetical protein
MTQAQKKKFAVNNALREAFRLRPNRASVPFERVEACHAVARIVDDLEARFTNFDRGAFWGRLLAICDRANQKENAGRPRPIEVRLFL